MALSKQEREQFLADSHIAALSVVESAERTSPSLRYVSVEGPVTRTVPGSRELSTELAARYLPADKVADYVEFEQREIGEQVAIYLRPQRWLSADLGSF